MASALKARGLYDPETIKLSSVSLPEAQEARFTLAEAQQLTGNVTRGKVQSARCIICHRIGDLGVDFGPNMSEWARTQPTETILRAIIEPDADIAHGYYGSRVETNDGVVIEGIIINDADPLVIQSMGGVTQMVPKNRIKEKKPLRNSQMMTPAQMGLSAQDVADIAAYLKAR